MSYLGIEQSREIYRLEELELRICRSIISFVSDLMDGEVVRTWYIA